MNLIQTIIISIVEGITEFLPISSTAHMDITRAILSVPATSFLKSFEIIIQLGAIMAVVVLYARKVLSSWKYIRNLIIAFIPTGVIGFILYKLIKSFLLGNILIEALALFIGGIIIIIFESRKNIQDESDNQDEKVENMSFRHLLILGTAQALAVIPGVSRSGAVIIAGRSMKINRKLITEFSFLLAVPTMLSAAVYDIYKSGFSFSQSEWGTIFIGFVVSFITAYLVIRWLLEYIRKHTFKVFGWYRVVLGLILILALFFKLL